MFVLRGIQNDHLQLVPSSESGTTTSQRPGMCGGSVIDGSISADTSVDTPRNESDCEDVGTNEPLGSGDAVVSAIVGCAETGIT